MSKELKRRNTTTTARLPPATAGEKLINKIQENHEDNSGGGIFMSTQVDLE
jgi:hypothetical protein